MMREPRYIIDSDVLISAKNSYYAFDICAGFWDGLIREHQSGRVFSLDRNRHELLAGRSDDDLVVWVENTLPESFFIETHEPEVVDTFSKVMLSVQRDSQFFDPAKAKFATGADGWLVAYASVHGDIVVTLEQPRPESRNAIQLPDICRRFDVQYMDPFTMLRELSVRFELSDMVSE